jgi:hypothetical protein
MVKEPDRMYDLPTDWQERMAAPAGVPAEDACVASGEGAPEVEVSQDDETINIHVWSSDKKGCRSVTVHRDFVIEGGAGTWEAPYVWTSHGAFTTPAAPPAPASGEDQ